MFNNTIATQITTLLANASVTFAQISYKSTIKTSAANKHLNVYKVVNANVQVFKNINALTSVYKNAVQKNANINDFTVSEAHFAHSKQCYSIVHNANLNTLYLYCIFNSVSNTTYYINDVVASKAQIADLLTASALKAFYSDNVTHNVTNNVTHSIICRTIKLSNLISITANKQTIVF